MKHFIILMVFFWSLNALAIEDLSLEQAIRKALENNYDVQIQQNEQNIATIKNNWGNAGRYPLINLTGNMNNSADFNDNEDFEQVQFIGGINLKWLLFDGFRVNITKERLNELQNLSKGNTVLLMENTVKDVILAYYNVAYEKQKLDVFKKSMQLSEDRFQYEKMKRDLGSKTSYEVLQFESAYIADKSNVKLQEANVKSAQRGLALLMGEENYDYILTSEFDFEPRFFQMTDLEKRVLENNSALKNQYISEVLLEQNIELVKSDLYPELNINTGGQAIRNNTYNSVSPNISRNRTNLYANFSLSYTIFNGGIRKRAVQIAKIENEIGDIETEQMKLTLKNRLHDTYDFYEARVSALKLAEQRLEIATVNLNLSEAKLKSGVINSFNYRDVQLDYLDASISYLNSIYNARESYVNLLKITGGIMRPYLD